MQNTSLLTQLDIENKVSSIWKTTLGSKKISANESFFEAGGNSLLMTKVHRELKKQFNMPITIVELFQYPTIESLSHNIYKKYSKVMTK
ncbi:Polyketide synthase PksN [Marinomonas spartinae]|uniref:Polyketide synthase PksN n=1 Tax=Marinomonas spartinae TaxID=1792290 RepID=A0A1A8TMC2_9GAMM|nr:acyl carrier protein [Marinomonas spartinae]SBS34248.1 Polyketide synthase PksN [Marinomonas spartinae]SBS34858.1 Polyketide synthase PksN [Marinomonas spartinae]